MKMNNKIVIKIGGSCFGRKIENSNEGRFDFNVVGRVARDILQLMAEGKKIVFVGSGVIGAGMALIGCLPEMPRNKTDRQRCAGVGQPHLMELLIEGFLMENVFLSQTLVTSGILRSPRIRQNILDTIEDDLSNGIIPYFNHQDKLEPEVFIRRKGQTIKTFPDNDTLGARIADIWGADTLLIFTKDVKGVLDERKKLIEEIRGLKEIKKCKILDHGHGRFGTGGFGTKFKAAEMMVKKGGVCIIGNIAESISDLLKGNAKRTIFFSE